MWIFFGGCRSPPDLALVIHFAHRPLTYARRGAIGVHYRTNHNLSPGPKQCTTPRLRWRPRLCSVKVESYWPREVRSQLVLVSKRPPDDARSVCFAVYARVVWLPFGRLGCHEFNGQTRPIVCMAHTSARPAKCPSLLVLMGSLFLAHRLLGRSSAAPVICTAATDSDNGTSSCSF